MQEDTFIRALRASISEAWIVIILLNQSLAQMTNVSVERYQDTQKKKFT
jgi:hypothetical protein